MDCEIKDGRLHITPNSFTEKYALHSWFAVNRINPSDIQCVPVQCSLPESLFQIEEPSQRMDF